MIVQAENARQLQPRLSSDKLASLDFNNESQMLFPTIGSKNRTIKLGKTLSEKENFIKTATNAETQPSKQVLDKAKFSQD